MFIGHFALGFAGKHVAPRAPLAWLLLALGAGLYVRATAPVDRIGRRALVGR
jgi:hypothetical protein